MALIGLKTFLVALVLVGCGTLVGNPEDEDDGDDISEVPSRNLPEGAEDPMGYDANGTPATGMSVALTSFDAIGIDSFTLSVAAIHMRSGADDWQEVELAADTTIDLIQAAQEGALTIGHVARKLYSAIRIQLADLPVTASLTDGESRSFDVGSEPILIEGPWEPTSQDESEGTAGLIIGFDTAAAVESAIGGDPLSFRGARAILTTEAGAIEASVDGAKKACVYPLGTEIDEKFRCRGASRRSLVKDGELIVTLLEPALYVVAFYGDDGAMVGKPHYLEVQSAETARFDWIRFD